MSIKHYLIKGDVITTIPSRDKHQKSRNENGKKFYSLNPNFKNEKGRRRNLDDVPIDERGSYVTVPHNVIKQKFYITKVN